MATGFMKMPVGSRWFVRSVQSEIIGTCLEPEASAYIASAQSSGVLHSLLESALSPGLRIAGHVEIATY